MFSKVIAADDLESINQGISTVFQDLSIKNFTTSKYCDEVYLKIKRAIFEDDPFQLLIIDLSFQKDDRITKIESGEALIETLCSQNIDIKIIVYTIDDRLQKVRKLFKENKIDAYVCKGRNGLQELKTAISNVYKNSKYLSPSVEKALHDKIDLEITDYDIALLKELSHGHSKEEISRIFKANNITPSSVSSIEKRQYKLFLQFNANNATHLISIVKDLGII